MRSWPRCCRRAWRKSPSWPRPPRARRAPRARKVLPRAKAPRAAPASPVVATPGSAARADARRVLSAGVPAHRVDDRQPEGQLLTRELSEPVEDSPFDRAALVRLEVGEQRRLVELGNEREVALRVPAVRQLARPRRHVAEARAAH